MSTPTHIIAGAIIAKYAMHVGFLPDAPEIIYPMSIIAANIPDIDSIFIHYPKDHRNYPFHFPLYWVCFLALLLFTAVRIHRLDLVPYVDLIAINLFIHFFLDTWNIRTGIYWLMPWKHKEFNFFKRVPYALTKMGMLRQYLFHPYILLELLILIGGDIYLVGR
jgi:hypothetical protein